MQLPYFYQPQIPATGVAFLSEETSKHCIQVLRMKNGEQLQITDGKGHLYTATIIKEDKKNCEVRIDAAKFEEKKGRKVSIAISLLKNANRFEWFLEKVTELGVAEIIPLLCKRTEKQHFRQDRMQSIIQSAMLQSKQTWLPILKEPTLLTKVLSETSYTYKLIAHCEPQEKQMINDLASKDDIQLLIGPEGDFTTIEIELALKNNYIPISLGETRLRTETAGVAAATLLLLG